MCRFTVFPIKSAEKKGLTQRFLIVSNLYVFNGGADGIRTHAPVTRSTSLAGKPLEPLEYYSNYQALLHYIVNQNACQFFLLLIYGNNLILNFF